MGKKSLLFEKHLLDAEPYINGSQFSLKDFQIQMIPFDTRLQRVENQIEKTKNN